ncbi:MAG: tetratricopeptide repeat protein [Calditrichaeota bacterium]|nr:tetratricopeptide repeat protein [Calditrichota bacterium]
MNNFFESDHLEVFLNNHPKSIVFAFLALRYVELGDYDKALAIAEPGIRTHPTYALGHYALGLCYYHTQDYTKAKTHLELSVAYDEKNPRAWRLLSEINYKLDLPLMAIDGNLQYFLLEPFDPEAVDRFQQEEMAQLEAFDSEPAISLDAPVSDSVQSEAPDSEVGFDTLFDEPEAPDEEINISQKVEEVFKETLGDMDMTPEVEAEEAETPDAAAAEAAPETEESFEDIFDNVALIDEDDQPTDTGSPLDDTIGFNTADFEDTRDAAPKPRTTGPKEFEEMGEFDDGNIFGAIDDITETPAEESDAGDINSELDDFFSQYELEELAAEDEFAGEDEQLDFGNILFDEEFAEEKSAPDADEPDDKEFMDYSAMIDEIISEKDDPSARHAASVFERDEDSEADADIPLPLIPDKRPDVPDEGSENSEPASNQTSSRNSAAPFGSSVTRFGRPPILSPTLGEIYISQGRYEEAIDVFRQLLEKDPRNRRYQKKIDDIGKILEKKSGEQ